MRTLHLNLKKKWFDMILSGEKTEEYRNLTEYWAIRTGMSILIEYPEITHNFKTITFSNGCKKNRPQFVIELKGIKEGKGKLEWGAEKDVNYFILSLGYILSVKKN